MISFTGLEINLFPSPWDSIVTMISWMEEIKARARSMIHSTDLEKPYKTVQCWTNSLFSPLLSSRSARNNKFSFLCALLFTRCCVCLLHIIWHSFSAVRTCDDYHSRAEAAADPDTDSSFSGHLSQVRYATLIFHVSYESSWSARGIPNFCIMFLALKLNFFATWLRENSRSYELSTAFLES